jgi:hypothetical protein
MQSKYSGLPPQQTILTAIQINIPRDTQVHVTMEEMNTLMPPSGYASSVP